MLTLLMLLGLACTPQSEPVEVDRSSDAYAAYPEVAEMLVDKVIEFRQLLSLENWRMHIEFSDSIAGYAATTLADPAYYIAVVEFDLSNFVDAPEPFVDEAVFHELFHILVWETDQLLMNLAWTWNDPLLIEQARMLREQLATRLSRMRVIQER